VNDAHRSKWIPTAPAFWFTLAGLWLVVAIVLGITGDGSLAALFGVMGTVFAVLGAMFANQPAR
jgi:hypothetical protein